jgi:hypothetical protein
MISCQAMQSMEIERTNFGKSERKTNTLFLKTGCDEKLEVMMLAEELGISVSLLLRLLMKQAVETAKNGNNPLPGYQL